MFKHLLIPTDGSDLSQIAVEKGVQFARETGARITGLTVTPPYRYLSYNAMQIAETQAQFDTDMQAQAQRNLRPLETAAGLAGVSCTTLHVSSEHPYAEIVSIAAEQGCDVIFMSSHGRRGVGALIMGSETHKVLTHTKIPVLVWR